MKSCPEFCLLAFLLPLSSLQHNVYPICSVCIPCASVHPAANPSITANCKGGDKGLRRLLKATSGSKLLFIPQISEWSRGQECRSLRGSHLTSPPFLFCRRERMPALLSFLPSFLPSLLPSFSVLCSIDWKQRKHLGLNPLLSTPYQPTVIHYLLLCQYFLHFKTCSKFPSLCTLLIICLSPLLGHQQDITHQIHRETEKLPVFH